MKILHLHPSLAGGGIEAMVCALANEMSKTDDVTVCSIFEPTQTDTFWFRLCKEVKKRTIGKKSPGFSLRVLIDIYNFIRKGEFDVVNLHGMFYYYVFAIILLHRKVNFFYTVHSDAKMENTVWDEKLLCLKKFCFQKGWVQPITISRNSQASFEMLYHAPNYLIFNGVPRPQVLDEDLVKQYRLTENTKVFIHAGRISTPKNQLILCKVFKRLIDEGKDVVLLVAGAKQSEDIFKRIQPFFCERIMYLGQRNDVPQLMACSDAMCLPSIWEGLPVTLLESLSVGCVPICTNVGGISDVIQSGVNGFLSSSPLEGDYYMAIMAFLSLPQEEVVQLRRRCQESFEKYDIVNTAKTYLQTYKAG